MVGPNGSGKSTLLEPDVLLLDEPTAHVDHSNARLIEETIQQLHATTRMTVVLASHDLRQAETLADRIVTLLDGQLFCGTIDNLFAGALRAEGEGFTFHGENDLLLHLAPEAIDCDQPDGGVGFTETPVRIALDAERLEIIPGQTTSDCRLGGTIESVHQCRDRCRVMVRLLTGQALCATLPQSDYARLGLNIGGGVRLRLANQALRVIPPGSQET